MVPQPSPGFIQQRVQSNFAFGGSLGQAQGQGQQHQQSTLLQQQHSTTPQSSQQQQQSNGTSNSLPPHLTQTPSLPGTAPSVSSASEVGLDPNDFPALGSTPAINNNSSSSNGNVANNVTTSYASQAGTGVLLGGATGAGVGTVGTGAGGLSGAAVGVGNSQPRDFTPDDFPALGGQAQTQTQAQNASSHHLQQNQENHPHPPGLNGFQHTDHSQQHRQTLLGSLGGSGAMGLQTPGMLNLGPAQARNVHPGFQQGQTEAEKQQQRVSVIVDKLLGFHAVFVPMAYSSQPFPLCPSPSHGPFGFTLFAFTQFCRFLCHVIFLENQCNLIPTDPNTQNNYALKLNQATHAAWNSPNVNPSSQAQAGTGAFSNPAPATQQNGSHQNPNPTQIQNPTQSQSQQPTSQPQQHLNAPPGVPLPTPSYAQQQPSHTHGPGAIANAAAAAGAAGSAPTPYTSNGLAPGDPHQIPNNSNPNLNAIPSNPHTQHPQTPAQQILMSAADRWGLLGLLAMIKNAGADVDQGLSSVGTDLGTMGLDMGYAG